MKFLLIVIFTTIHLSSYSQQQADDILRHVLYRIDTSLTGSYKISYRWSSLTDKDTSIGASTIVYFDKRVSNPDDSIAHFIWQDTDTTVQVYNGLGYDVLNLSRKTIFHQQPGDKGGIGRYIRSGNIKRSMSLFQAFLKTSGTRPYPVSLNTHSNMDILWVDNRKYYQITTIDTSIKTEFLYPNERPFAIMYRKLVIDTNYILKQYIEVADLGYGKNQYQEINIEHFITTSIPESIKKLLDTHTLIESGYNFIQKTPVKVKTLSAGDTLPNFKLIQPTGDSILLYQIKSRFLLIDFWYRSCAPCLKAMPVISRIQEKYKDTSIQITGINTQDKDYSEIADFLKKYNYNHQTLFSDRKTSSSLGINSYPCIVLIDMQSHTVKYVVWGYQDNLEEVLTTVINAALK